MDLVHSYLSKFSPPDNISELKDHKEIPVHIHIPKCGGSFIRSSLVHLLRIYCWSVRGVLAEKQGAIIYLGGDGILSSEPHLIAFCFFAPPNFAIPTNPDLEKTHKIYRRMAVDDFLKAVEEGHLDVFCLAATSLVLGLRQSQDLLKIETAWENEFKLRYFTVLRDPFERAKSLYYVLKQRSDDLPYFSSARPSLQEFSEFIAYHEPNWVSRFLSYLFKNETGAEADGVMNSTIFKSLLNSMEQKVKVIPMQSIGRGLQEIFSDVYSPYIGDFAVDLESRGPSEYFNRTTKDIIFKPEDIEKERLKKFEAANSYDIALFQKYHERFDI
jgi:hypothetical protein